MPDPNNPVSIGEFSEMETCDEYVVISRKYISGFPWFSFHAIVDFGYFLLIRVIVIFLREDKLAPITVNFLNFRKDF